MRCIVCENLSWNIICRDCKNNLLVPNITKRVLSNGLEVYSFYKYDELKYLFKSKYEIYGHKVIKIMAEMSFKNFAQNFNNELKLKAIPIDDRVKSNFSHTAILAKALQSKAIKPQYNTLHAQNDIQYAGKDLIYRKKHKRDFLYRSKKALDVILVDDIITTGTTILEAQSVLKMHGCTIPFVLTLCDAKG